MESKNFIEIYKDQIVEICKFVTDDEFEKAFSISNDLINQNTNLSEKELELFQIAIINPYQSGIRFKYLNLWETFCAESKKFNYSYTDIFKYNEFFKEYSNFVYRSFENDIKILSDYFKKSMPEQKIQLFEYITIQVIYEFLRNNSFGEEMENSLVDYNGCKAASEESVGRYALQNDILVNYYFILLKILTKYNHPEIVFLADRILSSADLCINSVLEYGNADITHGSILDYSEIKFDVARWNKYKEKSKNFQETINKAKRENKNNQSENTSNNSNGCYVATCVYGSYDCPEVWTLRRFRDYTLDSTWYGRAFIKTYYTISPTIVKYFGDYALFKSIFKVPLDKIVKKLASSGFENTPYNDKY